MVSIELAVQIPLESVAKFYFLFFIFIFIFIFYYCTADLSKKFWIIFVVQFLVCVAVKFQVQQPKNWVGSILRFVCSFRGIDSKFLW